MGPPFLRGGEAQERFLRAFRPGRASMGPPFLRGGEEYQGEPGLSCGPRRFNGAALFTGRRAFHLLPPIIKILSTCFNGAALFTGRRVGTILPLQIQIYISFNGAALFTGRRVSACFSTRHLHVLLQWGRPFYGAERLRRQRETRGVACFNGAALFTGRRADVFAVED